MSNQLPDQNDTKELSKQDVEARLQDRSEAISRHTDALKRELRTSDDALKDVAAHYPLATLGGSMAVGLVAIWLISRPRKPKDMAPAHRLLTELYMDAVADNVRYGLERGKDAERAVYDALQDRVPFILYNEAPDGQVSEGKLKQAMDLMVKTALGFAVKTGLDYLTTTLGVEEYIEPSQEQGDESGVSAVAAAASEEPAPTGS